MMNMTYNDYKKIREYFWQNHYELSIDDGVCPFKEFDNLVDEWYNVQDEYKNVDAWIKDLEVVGL